MKKTIFITGSTDGIGLESAKAFLKLGHRVLIHGRNEEKLDRVKSELSALGDVQSISADLSSLEEVKSMIKQIKDRYSSIDVLINNAGIFKTPVTATVEGYDIRFIVNTVAPYLITKELLSLIPIDGSILNVSSAAQSSLSFEGLLGEKELEDFEAYAQSKLGILMWSQKLGKDLGRNGPMITAVNPGSLLGSKMVKDAFGTAGKDLSIGVKVLVELSLKGEGSATESGLYYDNDLHCFAHPHSDAENSIIIEELIQQMDKVIFNG